MIKKNYYIIIKKFCIITNTNPYKDQFKFNSTIEEIELYCNILKNNELSNKNVKTNYKNLFINKWKDFYAIKGSSTWTLAK